MKATFDLFLNTKQIQLCNCPRNAKTPINITFSIRINIRFTRFTCNKVGSLSQTKHAKGVWNLQTRNLSTVPQCIKGNSRVSKCLCSFSGTTLVLFVIPNFENIQA